MSVIVLHGPSSSVRMACGRVGESPSTSSPFLALQRMAVDLASSRDLGLQRIVVELLEEVWKS